MGSTGTHRNPGMTDRAFFENEFPDMLGRKGTILACASKPAGGEWQRAFYAAVKNSDDAAYQPGVTWALVVLMHTSRNPNEYYNFTYKTLSEDMGPGEDECPANILDLLSPTTAEYAVEWRNRCRAQIERRSASRAIKDGTVIEFATPMKFSGGYGEAQRFRVKRVGRKTMFIALTEDGIDRFRCSITRWRDRNYTVVA